MHTTDLNLIDTDEDGYSDYEEYNDPDYDPLVYEERYGPLEMGREFLLGAVLGEWGADDHDNIYYMAGWIASGIIAIGDVRDLAASICEGDLASIGLNLLAFAPGAGDSLKVTSIVTKFVGKHPEMLGPVTTFVGGLLKSDEAADVAKAVEDLIKAPSESAIRKYGVKNWKESELFLKEKVGGESQKHFTLSENELRIVDQFSPDGTIHEMKMGRVYLSKFVKEQIDKDVKVLKEYPDDVHAAQWHFVKSTNTGRIGPSAPLRDYLDKWGIQIMIYD